MKSRNILGSKLNNIKAKQELHELFSKIRQQYPTIFKNIPTTWREKCLIALAQKCNYNKQWRIARSKSPCTSIDGLCPSNLEPLPLLLQPKSQDQSTHSWGLETITVVIIRAKGGESTICQMRDFIQEGPNDNINIDNLAFDQFITVLQEDIQFDLSKEVVSYHYPSNIIVRIANERSWKVAMEEMYTRGLNRFVFSIGESECFVLLRLLKYTY